MFFITNFLITINYHVPFTGYTSNKQPADDQQWSDKDSLIKYLGIMIDCHPRWSFYSDYVSVKKHDKHVQNQ